MLLVEDDVDD